MKFLKTVRAAIFSHDYVSHFKDRQFASLFWYLFRLCAIQTAVLILIALPAAFIAFSSVTSGTLVSKNYPTGLEVTIVDGQVSSNMPEPYYVPNQEAGTSTPKNLITIDTSTQDPVAALKQYDTSVLITKNSVVTQKTSGEIRIMPLKSIKNFHLTQTVAEDFFLKMRPVIYVIGIIGLLVAPLIAGLFTAVFYIVCLLFYGLVTWLIAKVRKVPMRYGSAYILSGYLVTLPILVDLILHILRVEARGLIFFVVFVIIAIVNIKNPKAEKVTETENVVG